MAIKIKGVIGADVNGQLLAEQISRLSGDIEFEIDSPGGSVFHGISIYNAIKNYDRGKCRMHVVGDCSSMAAYIMLAGDGDVEFEPNSIVVIHNPWSVTVGDYRDMQKEGKILEYKDGSLQVEIPSNASIGKVKLSLIDAGVEFVVNDKFEIKAAPVIEYCDVAVFAGETMKITGTNLSALPVTVMIGNQQVSPTSSDTEITFTVPANLSGDVKVILNFGENVRPAECEVIVLPAQTGDITNYVLENTSFPFAIEGNGLKGWNTNSIFYGNPYVEKDGNVWMALNGKNNTWNGALFQSTTLPKGKYRFSITVADVDAGTNRNVVLFAVMEGKDTPFPGISDDPKPGHFISQDKLLGFMNIKDQPNPVVATHSFEMTMDKSLPVTIGFATMLGDTRYLYISEIKVEHIE